MNQLIVAEAAYLAGLFDGEGSLGLSKRISKDGSAWYKPNVSISNSDYDIIQWCLDVTDIGTRGQSDRADHHKIVYIWRLYTHEMNDFLCMMFPYLRIKKNRAILLLEYLNNCVGKKNVRATEEIQNWRERIYRDLAILNKRGI